MLAPCICTSVGALPFIIVKRQSDVHFYTTESARVTLTYCVGRRFIVLIVLLSLLLASKPCCIFCNCVICTCTSGELLRTGCNAILLEKVFRYVIPCVSIKHLTAGCAVGF